MNSVNRLDARDWYAMVHIGGVLVAATVFLFKHPDVFNQWCVFVGTVGGIFHWLVIRDQKVPDADSSAPQTPAGS